ncbi:MAG TPA: restriction endonuclease, partial [Solirubrobacteraceae bacterium]|nr:restriction endonuclease [Solirubrobacteraceae bacterium]
EIVKAEFERLKTDFAERLNRVFSADEGHIARLMDKHFGEESSVAVPHRIQALLAEFATQMEEGVRKQLTSDSDSNPILAAHRASLQVIRDGANQQAEQLRATNQQLAAMRLEIAALKAEKEKLVEVAAEVERGTAKGRTYEEAVFEALDAIASAQGDDCDAVGDLKGSGGKRGDFVIALDACAGPARGRIVVEAKNSQRKSKKEALAILDAAMEQRDADFGIFVVASEEQLPAKTAELREFNGNKLFVVFDADEGPRVGLEFAYKLGRARVLMARSESTGVDAAAVQAEVERAQVAMEDVRRVKSQLTQATTYIGEAAKIVDAMAGNVRGHLGQIEALLRDAVPADEGEPE